MTGAPFYTSVNFENFRSVESMGAGRFYYHGPINSCRIE
jgi:hypothetical protein